VVTIHIVATIWSGRRPRQVQNSIGACTQKIMTFLFYSLKSKQHYSKSDISPYYWVNGYLPKTKEWLDLSKNNFTNYQLEITGLVANPSSLSLNDLKTLPRSSQIVKHCC